MQCSVLQAKLLRTFKAHITRSMAQKYTTDLNIDTSNSIEVHKSIIITNVFYYLNLKHINTSA